MKQNQGPMGRNGVPYGAPCWTPAPVCGPPPPWPPERRPLPPFCLGALLPPLPPPLLSPLVATPAKEERQQGLVQQEAVEVTRAVDAVFFASLARRNSLRESSSWARMKDE